MENHSRSPEEGVNNNRFEIKIGRNKINLIITQKDNGNQQGLPKLGREYEIK